LQSQKKQLIRNAILEENIWVEIGSDTDSMAKWPLFKKLIEEKLKKNDLLMVTHIDRCSDETLSFLKLQDKLLKEGITFISLDLPFAKDLKVNNLIAQNLATIAIYEINRRKERQKHHILAVKKAGKDKGRKTVISKSLVAKVKELNEEKSLPVTKIAQITNKSRTTIYKI